MPINKEKVINNVYDSLQKCLQISCCSLETKAVFSHPCKKYLPALVLDKSLFVLNLYKVTALHISAISSASLKLV